MQKHGAASQRKMVLDPYGRKNSKHAHGTATLGQTSSVHRGRQSSASMSERPTRSSTIRRRPSPPTGSCVRRISCASRSQPVQFSLFDDPRRGGAGGRKSSRSGNAGSRRPLLGIKKKYGKNAILSGGSYLDGATARERNRQIGGTQGMSGKIRRYHRPAAP